MVRLYPLGHFTSGQLPNGWNTTQYGIPEDIIARTDRVSLWALAVTAKALNHAGITDPYELYQYIYPSEVGKSLYSGMGSMTSIAQMFIGAEEESGMHEEHTSRREPSNGEE
jgi:fatty acid synthase subunit alpha